MGSDYDDDYNHYRDAGNLSVILESDDKERFLELLSTYADTIDLELVGTCASYKAKNCLRAMIQGEGCVPALELYARLTPHGPNPRIPTPLACVVSFFPEALDIIELLLSSTSVDHVNVKCEVSFPYVGPGRCPMDYLFVCLSHSRHLQTWTLGDSLFKLIILLCQWESKSTFDCARLLAPRTHGLNDIAWSYVAKGWLPPFAALVLAAPEKVMLPFDSGLTIRQRIMDLFSMLRPEGDLDHEEAIYRYMLIEACKLLDIFDKAGDVLRLYCSSMHEHVPPHKVLIDVASLLKKAGYALEPMDIDLRDCYRECTEIRKASVFKLLDRECASNKYSLPSSLTRPQDVGPIIHKFPYPGNCQLFHKLKSGPGLNLKTSASRPRLLSTAAGQIEKCGSRIPHKCLAYIALKLKKGIKF